jgi:hypothetical protein
MAAPQQATLSQLANANHAVNKIGAGRNRWDSVSTCEAPAASGIVYVSKTLGAPWLRMGAKIGTNDSSWIVVPV